uniref:Ankyrin repeat domain 63 n=1 Tax=Xiphophorus couchianus TaxID=32473 RepID=A0A3B5M3U5_9TELE
MMRPKDLRQGSGTKTFLDAMHSGKVHLARFILDALDGRIINSKTENSRTPLMYAVCLQDPGTRTKFTRLLLEKGANVNCQDEDGRTALSHACKMGHLDVVKLLVQFNADPDISDAWGNSALMYAAFSGHSQVLEFLVRAFKRLGLRLDRTNSAGHSAKEIANFFGHNQCVQILNFPCRKSACKDDPLVDVVTAVEVERRLPNRLPRHVLEKFSKQSADEEQLPDVFQRQTKIGERELGPGASPLLEAYSTGQADVGPFGDFEPKWVSSETCVSDTVPPVGPGTEVNRSAAGRGAPKSGLDRKIKNDKENDSTRMQ